MKIEIRLLTQLKQYLPDPDMAGDTQMIEADGNATIQDVMTALGIPLDMPKVIMLNEKQGKLKDELKEGDRIIVFPPVGGG
jgi:molybdopterin converting factor small subunit